MRITDVTPLILTFNEQENLPRSLAALRWANQIVVLDSASTDRTQAICQAEPNVQLVNRFFDNHTDQWNHGLTKVTTTWVLTLDADYVCGHDFAKELESIDETKDVYLATFTYAIQGRPLRGTLYPPRCVLFRTGRFKYLQDGHTQLLDTKGGARGMLKAKIIHDDRKPLSRWLDSQRKYAALEAEKLLQTPQTQLGFKDRCRKRGILAPVLALIYCLFVKGLFLNGLPGLFYTGQRMYAELLLSLELMDRRLKSTRDTQELPQ